LNRGKNNIMRYAFFIGCNIPARVKQYESSSRAVLEKVGVDLVDFREFTCCGYPLRNVDRKAFVLSAAGNLAIAESEGLDLLVLCKCGFGTLKEAQYLMREDNNLLQDINELLSERGLKYQGKSKVKHLLSVLYEDVGVNTLKSEVKIPYKNLNIATHYGCHALRPSEVTQFDNPVAPVIFDELVRLTGAKSIEWPTKLECCGAPLMGINDDLSANLARKKLNDGLKSGADYLCTSCPYCQIQFDTAQDMIVSKNNGENILASVLYPQLLGLSMGIDEETLGIGMNQLDISAIKSYLSQE